MGRGGEVDELGHADDGGHEDRADRGEMVSLEVNIRGLRSSTSPAPSKASSSSSPQSSPRSRAQTQKRSSVIAAVTSADSEEAIYETACRTAGVDRDFAAKELEVLRLLAEACGAEFNLAEIKKFKLR